MTMRDLLVKALEEAQETGLSTVTVSTAGLDELLKENDRMAKLLGETPLVNGESADEVEELAALAETTTKTLVDHYPVDGAFVFLLGEQGDARSYYECPEDFSFDEFLGCIIQLLGLHRAAQTVADAATDSGQTQPS